MTTEQTPAGRLWIESRRFDSAFFLLAPLIAVPVLITSPHPNTFSLVFACVLGVPHYLSTFTFFFWDETSAAHKREWPLFFGVPVLIVASLALAVVFQIPFVIQVVVYVWNAYHVARQNCGILSIYRHRAGVRDPAIRNTANSAIVLASIGAAFWNISYYPAFNSFLTLIWPGLPQAVTLTTAMAAVVALARLAVSLVRRFRSETPPRLPELAFLGSSLALFHPYLWMRDADQATLCMLLGHFLQYLAIVWLVHRRKFNRTPARASQRWLASMSTNLPLLLTVLLTVGGGAAALRLVSMQQVVVLQALYSGGLLAITLVHFYLDGLFWAFRRTEVRESLGPYLITGRSAE